MTKSGSKYSLARTPKGWVASKEGWGDMGCIAIFPDRIKPFLEAEKFQLTGNELEGFNKKGARILKFRIDKVMKGMILMNRKTGFRSTPIVEVL